MIQFWQWYSNSLNKWVTVKVVQVIFFFRKTISLFNRLITNLHSFYSSCEIGAKADLWLGFILFCRVPALLLSLQSLFLQLDFIFRWECWMNSRLPDSQDICIWLHWGRNFTPGIALMLPPANGKVRGTGRRNLVRWQEPLVVHPVVSVDLIPSASTLRHRFWR